MVSIINIEYTLLFKFLIIYLFMLVSNFTDYNISVIMWCFM